MIASDFNRIQELTKLVIDDMQKRYPDCNYTVKILLWDDGTYSVECRHGRDTEMGMIICTSTYYEDELKYEEFLWDFNNLKIDEKYNEYYIKKGIKFVKS